MNSGEQSEKIIWFEKFFPELLKKPFKEGIKEARELRNKARINRNAEDEGIALFAEGLLNRFSNRHKTALSLYNRAMKFFIQSESHEWIAALEHGIGHCYDLQGNPKEAEKFYLSSIEFYNKNKILKREAMVCVNLGQIYTDISESKKALYYLNRAYKIFSKLKNVHAQAVALNNTASIYNKEGEFDKALKFYAAGLKVFLQLKDFEKVVGNYTNLGSVNIHLKKYKAAEYNLLKAESYIYDAVDNYIVYNVYVNLGIVYTKIRKFKNAETYLLKALKGCREINDNNLLTNTLRSLGDLSINTGNVLSAKKYYEEALGLLRKYNYRDQAIVVNKQLSRLFEKEKNFEDALKHTKESYRVYADVYNETSFKEISVLKAEIEKQKAENEAEILRLRNLELKRVIEIKKKELNQAANYLVQKNDFVNSVIGDIKAFFGNSDSGNFDKEKFYRHLGLIERKKHLNQDVVHFEKNLNNMNLAFLDKLSKKFTALSRIELKICSLMKINLGTKDIAKLLSISHRTIETHRHHIIQKLKLPKGKSLSSFINTL